jgi:hypothetical protein
MKLSQVLSSWIWNFISNNSNSFKKEINELVAKEVELKLTPEKVRKAQDPNLFEQDGFRVRLVKGKNKDIIEFTLSTNLLDKQVEKNFSFDFPGRLLVACSATASDITSHVAEIRDQLFAIDGITEVRLLSHEVCIYKTPAIEWGEIPEKVTQILFAALAKTHQQSTE